MSRVDVRPDSFYGGATKKKPTRKPVTLPPVNLPPPPAYWVGYTQDACPPLSEQEIKVREELIWNAVTRGKAPVAAGTVPHLILTIGSAGAGKSTVARELVRHKTGSPDSYVELDFDELLDLVPEGEAVRAAKDITGAPIAVDKPVGFAFGWTSCVDRIVPAALNVFTRLLEAKYNVLVNSHDQDMLIRAQLQGYVTTLLYVAVTKDTAKRRAGERALKLGRFFNGSKDENWGWNKSVDSYWDHYRSRAAWYAMWADNFAVVANEIDHHQFSAEDFRVLDVHAPLPPDKAWHELINLLYDAMAKAHEECDRLAKK